MSAFDTIEYTSIRWLGGAGFLINSRGTTVMIDPVLKGFDLPLLIDMPIAPEEVTKLDAVLITHCDNDHYSVKTCTELSSACREYHSTKYVAGLMKEVGLKSFGHAIHEKFRIKTLDITMLYADHAWQNVYGEHSREFKDDDFCGFWIETPDGIIWAPGDTRYYDGLLNMPTQPNVIFFDFSDDPWHIGLDNAIKIANRYPDAELLLSHWGTIDAPHMKAFNSNPKVLEGKICNPGRIRILAAGEELCLFAAQPFAQKSKMNRIDLAKQNYHTLFGGEALTGHGNDPEMMDILQKLIFGEVFQTGNLDIKTREMITCITLTAMQTMPQLKTHIAAALNVGVTPIQVRELIYLCAPFIGFPKTLNALTVANEVFAQRGIRLPLEKQGTVSENNRVQKGAEIQRPLYGDAVLQSMEGLTDGLDKEAVRYLIEYGFGDIYTRKGFTLQEKELLIYALLISIEAESQLRSHTIGNIKLGNNKATLAAVAIQCMPYIGFPPAMKALRMIAQTKDPNSAPEKHKVRLSKIVVDPTRLEAYNAYLKEEIEASMKLEPGVLTLYATAETERPNHITILEIYISENAYQSHIKTPHFIKYKEGTLDMVQQLELIDTKPLIEGLKIK